MINSLVKLSKSPDFLSKNRKHPRSISIVQLKLALLPSFWGEWNDARHQRTPIRQFVIPRGCIATRHASIALPSHESRAFSFRVFEFRDYTRDHPRIQFPRTGSSYEPIQKSEQNYNSPRILRDAFDPVRGIVFPESLDDSQFDDAFLRLSKFRRGRRRGQDDRAIDR